MFLPFFYPLILFLYVPFSGAFVVPLISRLLAPCSLIYRAKKGAEGHGSRSGSRKQSKQRGSVGRGRWTGAEGQTRFREGVRRGEHARGGRQAGTGHSVLSPRSWSSARARAVPPSSSACQRPNPSKKTQNGLDGCELVGQEAGREQY